MKKLHHFKFSRIGHSIYFDFQMVRIGDILHGISIIVVCGQFTALLTDTNGLSNIFSDFYRKEGKLLYQFSN